MKIYKEQIVKLIEYWRKTIDFETYFKRQSLEKISVKDIEVVDIVGVRRCGKSSMLKLLIGALDPDYGFLYINFEDPFFIEYNSPQIIEEIINVYTENFNQNLKYIFFDEIQEIKHWEKAVRKYRDAGKYKIFVTGSSATLLSGEMSTLLTGRHKSCQAWPLNFKEFLNFSGVSLGSKKDIIINESVIRKLFDEYMQIGGFPAAVIGKDSELLMNYFYDILEKDIIARYDIRDKETIRKLAVYLMSNSGSIVSLESLKEPMNSSFNQLSDYLNYFKEAFLFLEVLQFSFSLKKQSKALKKYYAIDTGLANNVSYKFSEDKGRILENLILLELKKAGKDVLYYKTKNNYEVDFAIKEKNRINGLIQVAWTLSNEKTRSRELRSLLGAMEELNIQDAIILTYEEEEELNLHGKNIKIKPTWKWLLELN